MAGPEAHVKAELLVWARRSAGFALDEAARKAGVAPARLSAWESGDGRPSIPQLRKLAAVYKRPLAVFFLSEPPKGWTAMRDFRRLPEEELGERSPALALAIREAWERRQVALDLAEAADHRPRSLGVRASTRANPERLAGELRELVGVSLDLQRSWGSPETALASWRRALEDLGILVFAFSGVSVNEVRGFAIAESSFPVVAINSRDAPAGRVFTLIHELTHVALGSGTALCDLHEDGEAGGDVEVFCNRVAGAFLVPEAALEQDALVRAARGDHWQDEELRTLARRFAVSQEVVLRRLVTLGRASPSFYRAKRAELVEIYEQWAKRRAETTGGPTFLVANLSRNGRLYTRLVLEAYAHSAITASEVATFLGVRTKHIPALQADLALRGAPG